MDVGDGFFGSGECKVRFLPTGILKKGRFIGCVLSEVATQAGLSLALSCGGKGTCGKCRVMVKGKTSCPTPLEQEILSQEEYSKGIRLACQTRVMGNCDVWVFSSSEVGSMKILSWDSVDIAVRRARTQVHSVFADKQNLDNQISDEECVLLALGEREDLVQWTPHALRELPSVLRRGEYHVEVVIEDGEILDVFEQDAHRQVYGIAVDLGTTTVAAMLCDLRTGCTLASAASTNRQVVYGDDAVSRIEHTRKNLSSFTEMQMAAVSTVDELIFEMVDRAQVDSMDIRSVVVVGNTAMGHLFCGIDAMHLTQAPYVPVFRRGLRWPAWELGFRNVSPGARLSILPFIAGFVGSDTVGMVLACRLDRVEAPVLAMDVGTNGEVVLALPGGRMLACSAAAGPAFEGAHIECGMRASTGAICRVRLVGDLEVETVDDAAPVGICGTGLMDAVAAFLAAGIVDETGRFVETSALPWLRDRWMEKDGQICLVLGRGKENVWVSQKDIRELQLAKGALRAGVEILLKEANLRIEELDEIILAGAFGTHLDPANAIRLGLLPSVPESRVRSVGNAAGQGATLALLCKDEMERAGRVAMNTQYVEVSGRLDFQEIFADAMCFPFETPSV